MSLSAPYARGRRTSGAAEAAAVQAEARRVAAELAQPARRLTIRLRSVMLFLSAAVAVVVLLSLVQDVLIFMVPEAGLSERIYRLDVDTEQSLPTWFSSGLMLVCALTLLAIAAQVKDEGLFKALPWFLLSAAFFYVSLDEAISLHEWMSAVLGPRMDNTGLFYFAWTLPALVLSIAGLVCFLPFILRFSGLDRTLLIGSAVVFLSGALGVEMLSGKEVEAAGIATAKYRLLITVEETLEFSGVLLFLLFLLRRLRADHNGTSIRFE